ncbi:PAS domain-containing sensor histidine kinase [Niabella ginsenosidivorans]|uniref:PAS domain-containing sensor histidine kinase n=1 Tax=Niabella ginsenosidivorans TaxID=1176587 RepID=UPI0014721B2A|nr:PAS domain S-box protein [Niabella ginsenosidivorans]
METANIYKAIFENDRDGFAVVDNITGFFVDVNKTFCSITGKEKAFLLSQKGMAEVVPSRILKSDNNKYQQVLKGASNGFEKIYWYRKKEGEPGCIKVRVAPLKPEWGSYSLIVIEDITEIQFSKRKWKESEMHFRHLFDSSPVGLWEEDFSDVVDFLESRHLIGQQRSQVKQYLDAHPDVVHKCLSLVKIIDVNQAVLDQYKIADKVYFLKNINTILASQKGFAAAQSFLTAICVNADSDMHESEGVTATGEKIDFQLKWHVTPGIGRRRYQRVILASIDITGMKKVNRALEDASSRIATIINTIDGIVWTADPLTCRVNFMSEKIQEITGYPKEAFVGRELFTTTPGFYVNPELMSVFRQKVSMGMPDILEYQIINKNGQVCWLRNSISFIKEGEKVQLILGIAIDITAIKKSRMELSRSMEVLRKQNKRLMNFSYIVSHNLRAHSSNILSLCELILHTKDETERQELISLLEEVAQQLHNTMQGLNEVTNIHTAERIPLEKLNLYDYINNCFDVLEDRAAEKEIIFLNKVDPSVTVEYNKAYLESVLLNILSNAIKYSHTDRVLQINIEFSCAPDERVLTIADNGVGMDLEREGSRLFGLFKTFSANRKSRGIGLYITRNQVEAMGGRIEVESEPGKGSIFKIYFK